jgi:four helix bundle protein
MEIVIRTGFLVLDLRFAIWKSLCNALNMNETELKPRTKKFGLRVLKLVAALPKTPEGRAIGSQLVRSGTSVGANYRAACRGRSKAEFISKLGTVEEEADESAYWMELIIDAGLLKASQVAALRQEADELTAMMVASRLSASRRS